MEKISTSVFKKITSLRIDNELYSYIEELAKKEKKSVNNFIETLLVNATGYHEPNPETLRTIDEAKKEKLSLKRYIDLDQLFDDLKN